VFGRTDYRPYLGQTWTYVHRLTSYTGAAAFAVAAASGAMYVLAARKLRSKQSAVYLGSLERLERLTMTAVTLGFALLTVGIITGAIEMIYKHLPTSPWKVALAGSVWVVYAIVLHAPINPVFRGRRAAVLSVVGFILMIGTLIAVQFGSGGR
jgi:ABC-type transport system involved in cytochrome c biogenesis permease subunit